MERQPTKSSRREFLRLFGGAVGGAVVLAVFGPGCAVASKESKSQSEPKSVTLELEFQKRLEGVLDYMGTSGTQTLIDTANYINNQKRLPQSQREFSVRSRHSCQERIGKGRTRGEGLMELEQLQRFEELLQKIT